MAIIKNGKTRGRIKNLVYRVVDGVEIVQPYTRNVQQTEKTKRASAKFAKSSKMGSEVYQQIKSFASNFTTVKTYREIVSLFRGSIFLHDEQSKLEDLEKTKPIKTPDKTEVVTKEVSEINASETSKPITEEAIKTSEEIDTEAKTSDSSSWIFIKDTEFLPINKDALLADFLEDAPISNFSETECTIQISEFKYNKQGGKHPKDANYVEFFASVYHSHSDMTYSLSNFSSGRLAVGSGFPAQSVIFPLEWMDNIEKQGVIFICFGLSFYADLDSRMHLNISKFNPSVILGLWYKENNKDSV